MLNNAGVHTQELNQFTLAFWDKVWISNAARNRENLMTNEGEWLPHAGCVTQIAKTPGREAWILGSGPSLNKLPKTWKGLKEKPILIAALSQLPFLIKNDIVPDYACGVDANQILAEKFEQANALYKKTQSKKMSLIVPAFIDPGIVAQATVSPMVDKIYLFNPIQKGHKFISEIMPIMYTRRHTPEEHHRVFADRIKIGFLNAGCTTNLQFCFADYIGCDPIVFYGVDWAYGKTEGRYDRKILTVEPIRYDKRSKRYSSKEMMNYKLNFLILWRANLANVHLHKDSVDTSILEPILPPNDFPKLLDKEKIKMVDAALDDMGMKTVKKGDGIQVLNNKQKTEDPKPDEKAVLKEQVYSLKAERDFFVKRTKYLEEVNSDLGKKLFELTNGGKT